MRVRGQPGRGVLAPGGRPRLSRTSIQCHSNSFPHPDFAASPQPTKWCCRCSSPRTPLRTQSSGQRLSPTWARSVCCQPPSDCAGSLALTVLSTPFAVPSCPLLSPYWLLPSPCGLPLSHTDMTLHGLPLSLYYVSLAHSATCVSLAFLVYAVCLSLTLLLNITTS